MAFSAFTTLSRVDIARQLRTSLTEGLSSAEAGRRLREHGLNRIIGSEVSWLHILSRQFASPFIYMLVAASVLAYILGEVIDGSMIILFVLINAVLGFYQEYRSEQTVRLLQKYVVHRAQVIRDGKEQTVESTQIVSGDLIILSPGDIVPCDIRLVSDERLQVNESILTGETVSVTKSSSPSAARETQIYKATNMCFSGTVVVSGEACGIATATGRETVIGDIAKLTTETVHVSTFEKGIARFSKFILRLILVTLVCMFVANIAIKGHGADIPELIIFSIALAVSVIPEALPVVTTFSLSRGALRMAKNKVVVKRLSAIEDLGSIEILCTDKTGTLTENIMTVADQYAHASAPVIRLAALASHPPKGGHESENAFDEAIWKALDTDGRSAVNAAHMLHELPFDPSTRRNVVVTRDGDRHLLISRGAPEEVLRRSRDVSPELRQRVSGWMSAQGRRGRRVIAVSWKVVEMPGDITGEERDLTFAGLVAFEDPLKPTTLDAVQTAKTLGVQVKILTGDSPDVAGAVGYQIGLATSPDDVMTGDELDQLPLHEQEAAVFRTSVFARVSPEQKYRIIQILQKSHEVGFLGEGMNDAPALKIANVALVVHDASDIAREAADIVLLKKSLHVIVDGIREGRQVFANTTKYIKATLTSNFGNFYAVAVASLLIDFLPMLPLQILLVNLLSDFPMIAIAADTVDSADLQTPRKYDIKEIAMFATILGVVSTIFDFIFFGLFYRISPEVLQTNWFIGSILTELLLLFSIRTRFLFTRARRPSGILIWLSVSACIATLVIPFLPFAQETFHFTPPTMTHFFIIIGVAVAYFAVTEIVKLMYVRFTNHQTTTSRHRRGAPVPIR